MKVILMVIDGFGIGAAPDADQYGDVGSNTFLNMNAKAPLHIPNLEKLGLKNIDGIHLPTTHTVVGNYGRLREVSAGKDTTTGHFEMSGIVLKQPYPTFPNGLPEEVLKLIERTIGMEILGGEAMSGIEIIKRYGEEHMKTGKPIVYTSADSVIQIATHDRNYSIKELYVMCRKVRDVMQGEFGVARVIARPFNGKDAESFVRLPYRKDFALDPPSKSMLDVLKENRYDVVAVGKIKDIFSGNGITKHIEAKNNEQAILAIKQAIASAPKGLIFANLIDTDMLYGHRNDVIGYQGAVEKIDTELPGIIKLLNPEDVLIITGDHGNDPTTPSTDHSREYTPLLVYGPSLKKGVNLGTMTGFYQIAKLILHLFRLRNDSILDLLQ